jgi:hypothetical protein
MSTDFLIYNTSPVVTYCSNEFENVPVILQFEDSPLVSVVKEQDLCHTTEIAIHHSDGTYLAKVRGTRIYPVHATGSEGIQIRQTKDATICTLAGSTAFEIHHSAGAAFRLQAELYTPTGLFVKGTDAFKLAAPTGAPIEIHGVRLSNNKFQNCAIGILVRKDGNVVVGVGRQAVAPVKRDASV